MNQSPLPPLLLSLPLMAFWAWMARQMTRNTRLTDTERMRWGLAFTFLNIFAAIYYYFTEYRR